MPQDMLWLVDRTRALRVTLLALVIGYGALLRFDALTLTYGPVEHPGWLRAVQESRGAESVLRPEGFQWERWQGRYISDPYTYLNYAREMRSFYAAHRREPVFPFATKVSLRLLGDQDVAVSFASMFFSVLAIAATFLLGRTAFTWWVGLGAAAALAIEYDAVTWGIGGWRDDAFTCAVVLSAYGLLRMSRAPTLRNAVLLGVIAAAACLTRITALSFLLPGLAWLLVTMEGPWKARLRPVTIAAAVAALLAGPYLVNCWITFGDPLYAINVHADVYREAEGKTVESKQTAGEYIRGTLVGRPWHTIDTALQGMTTYPFTNKWSGFDRWAAWVGRVLSWMAVLGVFLFAGSPAGRVLLVVLAGSLVPYALTWRLIFDWRFTEHAYPFFLIAAVYAMHQVARLFSPSRLRTLASRPPARRPVVARAAGLLAVAAVTAFALRVLPSKVAAESLRAGEGVSIGPGARDGMYLFDDWSSPSREGNAVVRISQKRRARIRLPLPEVRSYDMTVRMDPFPAPSGGAETAQPTVRIMVNDQLAGRVELQWDPERMGAYRLTLPASMIRSGRNELALIPADAEGREAKIRFWYVRVRPQ